MYIPDSQLVDCPKTEWSGGTFRDTGKLAVARGTDLDNCNVRWKALREYQDKIRADEAAAKAPR